MTLFGFMRLGRIFLSSFGTSQACSDLIRNRNSEIRMYDGNKMEVYNQRTVTLPNHTDPFPIESSKDKLKINFFQFLIILRSILSSKQL